MDAPCAPARPRLIAITAVPAAALAPAFSLNPKPAARWPGSCWIPMQEQFVTRAPPARPPLYPPRTPLAVPQRRADRPEPEPIGLTPEMLRDIVIEQIG
jgi:hypothetical protein